MLNDFQKAFDNRRIKSCTAFIGQDPDDLILGHGIAIRASRSQGIVYISEGDYLTGDIRFPASFDPWIAAAVIFDMVLNGDKNGHIVYPF